MAHHRLQTGRNDEPSLGRLAPFTYAQNAPRIQGAQHAQCREGECVALLKGLGNDGFARSAYCPANTKGLRPAQPFGRTGQSLRPAERQRRLQAAADRNRKQTECACGGFVVHDDRYRQVRFCAACFLKAAAAWDARRLAARARQAEKQAASVVAHKANTDKAVAGNGLAKAAERAEPEGLTDADKDARIAALLAANAARLTAFGGPADFAPRDHAAIALIAARKRQRELARKTRPGRTYAELYADAGESFADFIRERTA